MQSMTNAVRPSGRAAFVRVVAVLALALAGIIGTAGSCWACSCAVATPAEQASWSTVAFVGTVVEIDRSDVGGSSSGLVHYVMTVERVHKGAVTDRVTVDSASGGGTCGLAGIREGGRYLVLADGFGEALRSGLCDGTVELGDGAVPAAYGFGAGEAPTTAATTSPPADGTQSARPAAQPGWWLVGLLGLVGLMAFSLRRLRTRGR